MRNVWLVTYINLIIPEIGLSIPFTLYSNIFEKSLYGGKRASPLTPPCSFSNLMGSQSKNYGYTNESQSHNSINISAIHALEEYWGIESQSDSFV